MFKYEIIIYWSKYDDCYIAEVPELPDIANGKTQEDALYNAQIVIKEWIETAKEMGREIPEPQGKLMYA